MKNLRKLSVGERIMYVNGEEPFNLYFGYRIKGRISLGQIEYALKKIQEKHPVLRAAIKEGKDGLPYFEVKDRYHSIPVRVVRWEDENSWWNEVEHELITPFDLQNGPVLRIVWLRGEGVSDLIVVSHHCVCDGGSYITLLSELLRLIDNPDATMIPYDMPGATMELLPGKYKLSLFKALYTKVMIKAVSGVFGTINLIKKEKANKLQAIKWSLQPHQTKAVLNACKKHGTTVHTALCVALMRGFNEIDGNKKDKHKVLNPVDIRRYLPQIKQDMLYSFAPAINFWVKSNRDVDFWEVAKEVKHDMVAEMEEDKIFKFLAKDDAAQGLVPQLVKFLKRTKGGHSLTLSNLGNLPIPVDYDNFKLESMLGVLAGFPWFNANTLLVNTLSGVMSFVLISNEQMLTKAQMEMIRDVSMDELQKASGWQDKIDLKGEFVMSENSLTAVL